MSRERTWRTAAVGGAALVLLLLVGFALWERGGTPAPLPDAPPAASPDQWTDTDRREPLVVGEGSAPVAGRAVAPTADDAVVAGHVRDAEAAPVSAVDVVAAALHPRVGGASAAAAATDDAGAFDFVFAPGAMVELAWRKGGYRPGRRVVPVPSPDVAITLQRAPSLRGRVVREDGGAVAGALVRWSNPHLAPGAGRAMTTSRDGRFEFVGVPATLDLEVVAAGALPVHRWTKVEWGMPELVIAVEAGRAVSGRVIDAVTGDGLAQASVELWFYEGTYTRDGRRGGAAQLVGAAECDDDGRFELASMPRSDAVDRADVWLWIRAPDHAPHARLLEAPERVGRLDLELYPAGGVRGRVVDADGAPVAGRRVYAESALQPLCDAGDNRGFRAQDAGLAALWTRDRPEAVAPFHGEREAFTGDDGAFVIDGVPAAPGGGLVHVAVPDGNPRVTASVRPGEVAVAPDLVLRGDGWLRFGGRVVDPEGLAVGGAEVVVGVPQTICDADGRFAIEVPARPQPTQVRVRAPGYVPARLDLPAADPEDLSITLRRGAALSVLVVDNDQQPVADATVHVYEAGAIDGARATGPVMQRGYTDGRGWTRLDGAPATCDLVVEYRQTGARHREVVTGVASGGAPVRVTLRRLELARGTADLFVRVDDERPAAAAGAPLSVEVLGARGSVRRVVEGGVVRLEDLPRGTWRVRVSAEGVFAVGETVELSRDRTVDLALGRGASLTGRLIAAGGPIGREAQVRVEPVEAEGAPSFARAARDGTFALSGVAPGRYRVSVPPFTDGRYVVTGMRTAQPCVTSAPIDVDVGADAVGPIDVPVVAAAPLRVVVAPRAAGVDAVWPLARDLRFRVLTPNGDVAYEGAPTDLMAEAAELSLVLPGDAHRVEVRWRDRRLGARVVEPGVTWRLSGR